NYTYDVVESDDGGTELSRTATTAQITISGNNDAPVATANEYIVDTAVITGNVLTEDTGAGIDGDIDSGTLSAVLLTDVSNGVLLLNADGSFTYTPNPGFSGTDLFTYAANDGIDNSASATVNLTVTAVTLTGSPVDPIPAHNPEPATEHEDDNETVSTDNTFKSNNAGLTTKSMAAPINLELNDFSINSLYGQHVTKDAAFGDLDGAYNLYSGLRQNIEMANHDLNASMELWQMIDIMKQQINGSQGGDDGYMQLVAKSATGMALSLSAGIITWALRGGVLLASMLSAVPLWKGFDPLPIIARTRKNKDDEKIDDSFNPENDDNAARLLDTTNTSTRENHSND
ncbi:MAG: Ig-like domain-containing protein, partial [Gammaproteobacteria bacterium]